MPAKLQRMYISNKWVPNFIIEKYSEGKEILKEGDKTKYLLKEGRDLNILNLIYHLEKQKLSSQDKALLKLIKSQLEND